MVLMNLPQIPSAVTLAEATRLAELAQNNHVLEVGADRGFSTVVLGWHASIVDSIDWFRGDGHAGWHDVLGEFWENLSRYNVRDKVRVHIGPSRKIMPLFPSETFGLCFIDAFHEEDEVYGDAVVARRLVSRDGYMAFHDYGRFGVKPAVDRLAEEWSSGIEVVESLAVIRPWQ